MRYLTKLSVDCEANDEIDIRCGGPRFLGFDFYIANGQKEVIAAKIRVLCIKYKRRVNYIRFSEPELMANTKEWTIKRIEKEIAKGY